VTRPADDAVCSVGRRLRVSNWSIWLSRWSRLIRIEDCPGLCGCGLVRPGRRASAL